MLRISANSRTARGEGESPRRFSKRCQSLINISDRNFLQANIIMRCALLAICCGVALSLLAPHSSRAADSDSEKPTSRPVVHIETAGFDASEADIRAVLDSAAQELWRFFPDDKLEPIVVVRGHEGPITLFKRNDRGEIVVRLDTEKTYWSQYAYQFAHELTHVLCGFREGYQGNQWFEETVCETGSLYVLRAMSRTWKTAPPYEHWKDYRDALRGYADDVIRGRDKASEIYAHGLAAFYLAHKSVLQQQPNTRELNGAMALVLLHLLEEKPERWEAVRWLNSGRTGASETFPEYLQRWHDAVPERHREFVQRIAEMYGVGLKPGAAGAKIAPSDTRPTSDPGSGQIGVK